MGGMPSSASALENFQFSFFLYHNYSNFLIPLQSGNPEHPQKGFPAFCPAFAIHFRIFLPHSGHVGASFGIFLSFSSILTVFIRYLNPPSCVNDSPCAIICFSNMYKTLLRRISSAFATVSALSESSQELNLSYWLRIYLSDS